MDDPKITGRVAKRIEQVFDARGWQERVHFHLEVPREVIHYYDFAPVREWLNAHCQHGDRRDYCWVFTGTRTLHVVIKEPTTAMAFKLRWC